MVQNTHICRNLGRLEKQDVFTALASIVVQPRWILGPPEIIRAQALAKVDRQVVVWVNHYYAATGPNCLAETDLKVI